MHFQRAPNFFRAILALAVLSLSIACAAQAATAPAATQVRVLAEEFYLARARFDPLYFATANGDSAVR